MNSTSFESLENRTLCSGLELELPSTAELIWMTIAVAEATGLSFIFVANCFGPCLPCGSARMTAALGGTLIGAPPAIAVGLWSESIYATAGILFAGATTGAWLV